MLMKKDCFPRCIRYTSDVVYSYKVSVFLQNCVSLALGNVEGCASLGILVKNVV